MHKTITHFAGNALLLAFLLLGTYSVQGQTTLLSESFDGATFPPTGWTRSASGTNNFTGNINWSRTGNGGFT